MKPPSSYINFNVRNAIVQKNFIGAICSTMYNCIGKWLYLGNKDHTCLFSWFWDVGQHYKTSEYSY